MACGMATSLEEMVVFRLLQGICGAPLVPLSQTVLLNINTREEHGRAMAIWGAGIMVGPIIGPTLGGWLTETLDWRWVFYVNLPVGLLALAGMLAFLPRTPTRQRGFDFFGFAMLSLAIGALQLFLDRGEQVGWFDSPEIWIELGLVISGLWAFAAAHHRARRTPSSIRASSATGTSSTALAHDLHGRRDPAGGPRPAAADAAERDGLSGGDDGPRASRPRGVGTMISMLIVGRLIGKVDARLLIFTGLSLIAFSLWQMTGFSHADGQRGPWSSRASSRGWGSAWSSCRSRRSPSRRSSLATVRTQPRCSA